MPVPSVPACRLEAATERDIPLLMRFVNELAAYERLAHEVTATDAGLHASLFGPNRVASAVIAYRGEEPAGYALYFFTFSTFLGKPGLFLEDLYVTPAQRRRGIGRALLVHLAQIAVDRGCGRMEWVVLDWNELALRSYRAIGAVPMSDWTVQRLTGDALTALAAERPAVPQPSDR
jgi:GNAT superfamily N-acetyltransferase